MQEKNIAIAVPAGLAATGVMSVVMLLAPLFGIPEVNLPRLLGTFVGMSLSVGMLLYFILGIGVAVFFATVFSRWLPAPAWLQGALLGVGLWLFLMVIGGPLIGWGLFASNTSAPAGILLTSLLGHLAFGVTLGYTYEKVALRIWSV